MRTVAERIARHAEAMGLGAVIERSRLSTSAYVLVDDPEADDEAYCLVKVRVSTHVLPPTYAGLHGDADFEVGTFAGRHRHPETNGDWVDALVWLGKQFGRALPKRVAARVSRREAEKAETAARRLLEFQMMERRLAETRASATAIRKDA